MIFAVLTIALISCRAEPRYDWLFDSLRIQGQHHLVSQIVLVDFFAQACDRWTQADVDQRRSITLNIANRAGFGHLTQWVPPKPTVWAGPHRLTRENWWTASNSRNTAICYTRNNWIAFVDDRGVLGPEWLSAVDDSMRGSYIVCGTYEKVHNLAVEGGRVKTFTPIGCRDSRIDALPLNVAYHGPANPHRAPGEWTYGCSLALPMLWALGVNGFDETADSLSSEDTAFGMMLQNNNLPIRFDLRMKVIQDRTPGHTGPTMKRIDKGISPADKSHAYVDNIRKSRRAPHWWRLREIRNAVLSGREFPIPTGPTRDWYDAQLITEM